jgi:hemoglobin-like flavoprotein
MSPDQKALVKETWKKVVPIADTAARLFYERLFQIDPATTALFVTTDLAEQRHKLMQALAFVVQGLDRPEALEAALADLGQRHAAYGVVDGHFDSVGASLLWTLEQGLGSDWTPQAKAAWADAYALAAGIMRRAMSAT